MKFGIILTQNFRNMGNIENVGLLINALHIQYNLQNLKILHL